MEIECINDENLEDVSGGFTYSVGSTIRNVKLSQKEFDELKEAKIIDEDGNLHYRDVRKAFDYLEEKGYTRNMKIIRMRMMARAMHEAEMKCWRENKPIMLEII